MLVFPTESSAKTDSFSRPSEMFAESFIKLTAKDFNYYIVSPDSLVSTARGAAAELSELLKHQRSATSEWALRLIGRFDRLATMILSRKLKITAPTASAVRIMALCLAAQADQFETSKIGDEFRKIATGVTWMERRFTGVDESTETIVLAIS